MKILIVNQLSNGKKFILVNVDNTLMYEYPFFMFNVVKMLIK